MTTFPCKLMRAVIGSLGAGVLAPALAWQGAADSANTEVLAQDISWFLAIAILLCIALPAVPIGAFLRTGWQAKRNDITDGVSAKAKQFYLIMFSLSDYQDSHEDSAAATTGKRDVAARCEKTFADFYARWYGRQHYIFPVLVFLAVLCCMAIHIALSVASTYPAWQAQHPGFVYSLQAPALCAIAGAYLWVTSDFIKRARRLDFAPSDINWGTLRMVIAVPMGYAFADLTPNVGGAVVAFALGALPLSAIQDMLRERVYKWSTTTVPVSERNDALTKLQGVDDDIAIRLQSEGITTIPQMAYCDPIRLVMRSNLTFNFVIDCMNQSLCWVYFEEQLKKLRPLGLRGAVEIAFLMNALASTDEETRRQARSTLTDVTDAIKPPHTEATLRYTFTQIAEDPYTHFLNAVWINPFTLRKLPPEDAGALWDGGNGRAVLHDGQGMRPH